MKMLCINCLTLLCVLSALILTTIAASTDNSTSEAPNPGKNHPKVKSVEVACGQGTILGRIALNDPFHGSLYARGFPFECRSEGNGTKEIRLTFTVDKCGTKVTNLPDGKSQYEVFVYLQFDTKMQQLHDQHFLLKCTPQDLVVKSARVEDLRPRQKAHSEKTPTKEGSPLNKLDGYMDILRGEIPSAHPIRDPVYVGENLTMLVKLKQSDEIESKVVNCIASDGSDKNQQLLINSKGCTVDSAIMPNLKEKHDLRTGYRIVYAKFQAFKFPLRENLHIRCSVIHCNVTCLEEGCDVESSRRWTLVLDVPRQIADGMQVFNSIQVVDPMSEIASLKLTSKEASPKEIPTVSSPKEEDLFCLSSTRIVILIGFLLGILLISLVVTICMCVRAKELRRRLMCQNFPYGKVAECS